MTYPLDQFAFVADIDESLAMLANLAQPESWEFRTSLATHKRSILFNYIHATFARLVNRAKIAFNGGGSRASYNTGLVTPDQQEILAYFVPLDVRRPDGVKWRLDRFCRESDPQLLEFARLPPTASYFTDPADLIYDVRLPLRKNVDRISDENRARFPEPLRSTADNQQLRNSLSGAIDHAVRRVQRNYKTAIPQFHQGRVQLLLPLCLTSPARSDLALVIDRQRDGYHASTCLTLDTAYNNARLLARPDTEWLQP